MDKYDDELIRSFLNENKKEFSDKEFVSKVMSRIRLIEIKKLFTFEWGLYVTIILLLMSQIKISSLINRVIMFFQDVIYNNQGGYQILSILLIVAFVFWIYIQPQNKENLDDQ